MSHDMIEIRVDTGHPEQITGALIETKIDGGRHEWNGSEIISERGIVRNARFPHLVDELKALNFQGRGEVAVPFGNIHTLNKSENWPRARFYLFDMWNWQGKDTRGAEPFENRRLIELADSQGKQMDLKNLRIPFKFKDFQTAWKWVIKHSLEGVVIKTKAKTFKCKYMKEEKLPIVGFEPGAVKGSFLIERAGVVGGCSALSVAYVQQYKDMLSAGKAPYAEIEYMFLTDSGKPFQPRLRRMGTLAELQVT